MHSMDARKCSVISYRKEGEGDSCSWNAIVQDQDSSFSVRKNEVKSNLIAITGNSCDTNELWDKGNDVQDCSRAARCDVPRLIDSFHKQRTTTTPLSSHQPTIPPQLLCDSEPEYHNNAHPIWDPMIWFCCWNSRWRCGCGRDVVGWRGKQKKGSLYRHRWQRR